MWYLAVLQHLVHYFDMTAQYLKSHYTSSMHVSTQLVYALIAHTDIVVEIQALKRRTRNRTRAKT